MRLTGQARENLHGLGAGKVTRDLRSRGDHQSAEDSVTWNAPPSSMLGRAIQAADVQVLLPLVRKSRPTSELPGQSQPLFQVLRFIC